MNKGTFAFVDGLSRFFLPPGSGQSSNVALELVAAGGIKGVTAGITQVVQKLARPLPLLILENLDFMLAAAGEGVGALDMADMVLDLREVWVSPMIGGVRDVADAEVAVSFYDRIGECRCAVCGTSADTAGGGACSICGGAGSRRGVDSGAAAAGYGGCEGCEWGY